ncbi:hypothetical protein ILUMI_08445 [Ignelater luminosus]|uniref:Integrin beta n=1 Tax=Ignelater luminosus TaxID=2038154 RepID=A0A8K0D1M2_IGNLU|nr:hypothetical protein ILUMI_08445 [Ignelater luminosus]
MEYIFIFLIVFSGCFKNLYGQNVLEERAQETTCEIYNTCSSCIQAETYCVWCFQENFNDNRCGPIPLLKRRGCSEDFIYLGDDNSTIEKVEYDKDFKDVTNPDSTEESVQMKPQKLRVKLQRRNPLSFQFKYRIAKNYPLDLYYLMDLTLTMRPDIETMAKLGRELTELLQNLTKHFRVAFGYYSDKVAMPYSKMTQEFLENPCINEGTQCMKGFDFVHSLNFTSNIDEFIQKVNASKTTANLDNLEGGFDALYQIILCENAIQWRNNSRKIIVIATDGTLHFAGDGVLAGAVKRNSDKCLLDKDGIYSESLIYDYPSLGEIYHNLQRRKMNVLFAAKEDIFKYYEDLQKIISSVSYVGKLAEESSNVLNLVKEGYFKVVQNVKFSANHSDNLKVTIKSNCIQNKVLNSESMCNNVEEGKEYVFDVIMEVLKVPENMERETVTIEEQNIAEKLIIEVEYSDKCKCNMKNQNSQINLCSNHGSYVCGVCECEDGWEGENCDLNCEYQRFEECRERNESYTSSTCYGRGDCYCGRCICDEAYTGKYCQEKQCPKNKRGEVCSGTLHGVCKDGTCFCSDLYSGEDCSCPLSKKHCIAPGSDLVCSGQGYCRCGKCVCSPKYSGDYCEQCPTCSGLCGTYEDCVLATLTNGSSAEKCSTEDGTTFIPNVIDEPINAEDITTCYVLYNKEERSCGARYKYNIRKDFVVELDIYSECSEPLKAGILIGIIIAVILGGGIMLILIWKAKLMNDERREYARFQENVKRSRQLEENPLYNSPIRTYEMPTELQHYRNN